MKKSRARYVCAGCGKELERRRWNLFRCCENPECRRTYLNAAKQRDAERAHKFAERIRRRNEIGLQAARAEDPSVTLEQIRFVPISRLAAKPIANLPQRRARAFRDHLMRQISQAATLARREPSQEIVEQPAPAAIKQLACATCWGRCCEEGDIQAFVDEQTIRRYMDDNPAKRPRDVLHDYLELLPKRTVRDSCVFHSDRGCNLPRRMRADICNRFECNYLKKLGPDDLPDQGPVVLVAIAEDDRPARTARFDVNRASKSVED